MESLPDWLKIVGVIIGVPLYLYFNARWITSAIVRSYFEVKREFQTPIKKEAV